MMLEEESRTSDQTVGDSTNKEMSIIQIVRDTSQPQIISVKFDGSNYLTWSKSVLIYIQGKDKEEYLTGEVVVPPWTDSCYWKWKIENAIVMSWLLNSMKPKISNHFLFLETTHQIWIALAKLYSQMGHTAKVYELRQRIAQSKQENQPLAIYYSFLRKMWDELDHYTTYCPACVKDTIEYKKQVESI